MQVHRKIARSRSFCYHSGFCVIGLCGTAKKKAAALLQGSGGKQVHLARQEVVKQHKTGIVSRKMPHRRGWRRGALGIGIRFGGTWSAHTHRQTSAGWRAFRRENKLNDDDMFNLYLD